MEKGSRSAAVANGQISAEEGAWADATVAYVLGRALDESGVALEDAKALAAIPDNAQRWRKARKLAGAYVKRGPAAKSAIASLLFRMAERYDEAITTDKGEKVADARARVGLSPFVVYFPEGEATRQRRPKDASVRAVIETADMIVRRRRGECVRCGTVLSRFSTDDYCGAHAPHHRDRDLDRKRIERLLRVAARYWHVPGGGLDPRTGLPFPRHTPDVPILDRSRGSG